MKKIHVPLLLCLMLLASGCYSTQMLSGTQLMNVQQGMSPQDVRAIFGSEPDYRRFDGDTEEWEYRRYSSTGNAGWSVVLIRFTEGRVSGMDSFKDRSIEIEAATINTPSPTAITTVGAFPNHWSAREVQVMSEFQFQSFLHDVKFTTMSNEQKKKIEQALEKYDFTSQQAEQLVKEISYTPDRVELIKRIYPCVRDKRNFDRVVNTLGTSLYREKVRKFIHEYHKRNQ